MDRLSESQNASADVWKSAEVVQRYMDGVRGGIPLEAEQFDTILRLIAAMNQPITRVMDVGCGDGILGAHILNAHPDAHCVFTDFSECMLDLARKRLEPFAHRATVTASDYGDPTWVDQVGGEAPYEVIVSGFSIHHQTDEQKRRIYAEIFDLLAPGCMFINLEHVKSATPWIESICDDVLVDAMYEADVAKGGTRTREDFAREHFYRDDKDANILAMTEDQCGWLREIGYTHVDCYFKLFELAIFGGRKPM